VTACATTTVIALLTVPAEKTLRKRLGKRLGIQYCNALQCIAMSCNVLQTCTSPFEQAVPTNMTPPPAAANIGHLARVDLFNLVKCIELTRNQNKSKVGFWKKHFQCKEAVQWAALTSPRQVGFSIIFYNEEVFYSDD